MNHFSTRRALMLSLISSSCLPSRVLAAPATSLEFGILPNISASVLLAQYKPLRDFMARRLGREIHVSTAPSWGVFQQRTMAFEYDVVVTASHIARIAQIEKGFVPLVIYEPQIKGMIACAKARPLKSIAEIKGRTLVLSNPKSLVTLRGFQWMEENGLVRGTDFKTVSTPTDDSVGNVVLHQDAVAAMLSGGEYRAIPTPIRDQLQIVTTFAEVPGFVVLASPRVAPELIQSLRQEWLNFSGGAPEGQQFFAATGFTAMRELPPDLMKSMDPFVNVTKTLLAEPG